MDFASTSAGTTSIAIGVAASIRVLVRHFAYCVVLLSRPAAHDLQICWLRHIFAFIICLLGLPIVACAC